VGTRFFSCEGLAKSRDSRILSGQQIPDKEYPGRIGAPQQIHIAIFFVLINMTLNPMLRVIFHHAELFSWDSEGRVGWSGDASGHQPSHGIVVTGKRAT
jgi:hypothetical protein